MATKKAFNLPLPPHTISWYLSTATAPNCAPHVPIDEWHHIVCRQHRPLAQLRAEFELLGAVPNCRSVAHLIECYWRRVVASPSLPTCIWTATMFHCPLFVIIRLQYSVDHYTLCLLLDHCHHTVFTAAISNKQNFLFIRIMRIVIYGCTYNGL